MRGTPFFHRLLIIIVIILLSGCLGKSQSSRFYALSTMQEDRAMSKSQSPARNAAVAIGPIKLADYLDQSNLVIRAGDDQVLKAEYEHWAGSFKDNLNYVLSENIGFLVPTNRIFIYPWSASVPIDYQVTLDVVRCDGELGKDVLLVARWSVLGGGNKQPLEISRSSIREPVYGSDYAALVAAQSRAVAKLSQKIVEVIHASSRGSGIRNSHKERSSGLKPEQ